MSELEDVCRLEKSLISWIEAQPNSAEIKAWMLTEHARRCAWQDDCGTFDAHALSIEWDVLDALFCMSGLTMPVWWVSPVNPVACRMPHDSNRCCAAYFSTLVYLKQQLKEAQS